MKRRPVTIHPLDPTLAIVQLSGGRCSVISACDALAVGTANWHSMTSHGLTYAIGRSSTEGGNRVLLHRLIARLMGIPSDRFIDHVDGNGLNNARHNLRSATRAENLWNSRRRSDNKSGVKGVIWNGRGSKWHARIRINGRTVSGGMFDSVADAASAIRVLRARAHGEFANHGTN